MKVFNETPSRRREYFRVACDRRSAGKPAYAVNARDPPARDASFFQSTAASMGAGNCRAFRRAAGTGRSKTAATGVYPARGRRKFEGSARTDAKLTRKSETRSVPSCTSRYIDQIAFPEVSSGRINSNARPKTLV